MWTGRTVYRRRLPHYQSKNKTYFGTFCTANRWVLPPSARDIALVNIVAAHGDTAFVHTTVVMPDHAHMVMTPLQRADGVPHGVAEILRRIKGSSSRRINEALCCRGHVWQHESWDHDLRK